MNDLRNNARWREKPLAYGETISVSKLRLKRRERKKAADHNDQLPSAKRLRSLTYSFFLLLRYGITSFLFECPR